MEKLGWLTAQTCMKDELRSALTATGVQSVMITGTTTTPLSSVHKTTYQVLVSFCSNSAVKMLRQGRKRYENFYQMYLS